MLARRLFASLATQTVAQTLPNRRLLGRPMCRVMSSLVSPEPAFLHPRQELRPDEVLIGAHGPLENMDIKTSTVFLSNACEMPPLLLLSFFLAEAL